MRIHDIKILKLSKTAEYVNNLRDLKLTKSFVYQLVRSHKYVKTDTIINLIKKYSNTVYDLEEKIYGSNLAGKNIMSNIKSVSLKNISWSNVAIDSLTYIEMCTRFKAAENTINKNKDILNMVFCNSDSCAMRSAANKLEMRLEDDWLNSISVAVSDNILSLGGNFISSSIHTILSKCGPVGFFTNLALTVSDKLCNISGQCKNAVMAYGASSIAYSINKEFEEEINKIPIVNQYYNIRLVDVQNNYYRLAYARLLSEKKYVAFKESAPELFLALRDNSDITSSKIMISKLEKVLADA